MLAGNKVLNKMALVPMESCVLYLVFLQAFLYVAIYPAILATLRWCVRSCSVHCYQTLPRSPGPLIAQCLSLLRRSKGGRQKA